MMNWKKAVRHVLNYREPMFAKTSTSLVSTTVEKTGKVERTSGVLADKNGDFHVMDVEKLDNIFMPADDCTKEEWQHFLETDEEMEWFTSEMNESSRQIKTFGANVMMDEDFPRYCTVRVNGESSISPDAMNERDQVTGGYIASKWMEDETRAHEHCLMQNARAITMGISARYAVGYGLPVGSNNWWHIQFKGLLHEKRPCDHCEKPYLPHGDWPGSLRYCDTCFSPHTHEEDE